MSSTEALFLVSLHLEFITEKTLSTAAFHAGMPRTNEII